MFENYMEQFQKSMKPASDLIAVNAKVMEKLVEQQSAFFTGMMADNAAYTRNFTDEKDLSKLADIQNAYAADMQEKLYDCAKETYTVFNDAKEEAGEIFRGMFAEAGETAQAAARKATGATKSAAPKKSS